MPDDVARSVAAARPRHPRALRRRAPAADQRRRRSATSSTRAGTRRRPPSACPTRSPPRRRRFVNGVLAHSLDYDDTHLPSVLHPSASVVPGRARRGRARRRRPASRPSARSRSGSRSPYASAWPGTTSELGNSVFFEHGQHATSITGAMGCAVAASLLYGADETGVARRPRPDRVDGVRRSSRPTAPAAPSSGCTAAWPPRPASPPPSWSRRGFTGPPTVLEGRFGFFEAWLHGQFFPDAVTDGLGEDWSVPGIFFKPYPANHFTHTVDRRRPRVPRARRHARATSPRSPIGVADRGDPHDRRADRGQARAGDRLPGPVQRAVRRDRRPVRRRRPRPRARRLHRRARPGPGAPRR